MTIQHVFLYLQFQEMMGQYEENLQNERIEKKRMSEDYENRIERLTRVRNLLASQIPCPGSSKVG